MWLTYWRFNPHSRTGSDGRGRGRRSDGAGVSIHTPARGVTSQERQAQRTQGVSIHTPARGVTMLCAGREVTYGVSIHTPARGVTIEPSARVCAYACFNPHSRTGSDFHTAPASCCQPAVSIHTPARGVTL